MTTNRLDSILHCTILGGQARALLIRSTALVEDARRTHGLSRTATAALGRLMTATAIFGAQLKGDTDSVTCTVRGDGPIGMMIAVGKPDGSVKGYVQNPQVELPRVGGKLAVGDAVGHDGTLTVVRDLGMKEPYVGHVRLVSGELGEDFAAYLAQSEQTPSVVSLGVLTAEHVLGAGGLIVQMLPGAQEQAIRAVEASAPGFRDISRLFAEHDTRAVAEMLLGGLDMQVLEETGARYLCDCGRERVERALISIGREELSAMIEEAKPAQVSCQFCGKTYEFDADALKTLYDAATRP